MKGDKLILRRAFSNLLSNALYHSFDRFYRADKARTCCPLERVGLGMEITQSIAKAHGGNVSVHSQDKVTTFTFSFNEVS